MMEIRTHPYMNVLYSTRKATLGDLGGFSGTVVRDLYRYVTDLDLLVCGPQYWFYYGMDGNPETRFTLEIALPVQGKIPTAVLPYSKRIPSFSCLCSRHEGPWEGIAGKYKQMLQYVAAKELKTNEIYAEAYLHIDLEEPANQLTEILVGLC